MEHKIGILGGMGPEATVYLLKRILYNTRAEQDGDHIPVIIWNDPRVPDRTEAIIHEGPSPLPMLREGALFLERSGCTFILMPCVTAHYYYREILETIHIPFHNLVEETGEYIVTHMKEIKRIGLLATTGTLQTGLFNNYLEGANFEILAPDPATQNKVMAAIYGPLGAKAGDKERPRALLLEAVSRLEEMGSEVIVSGCTEVPLILAPEDIPLPLIDPMDILARNAVIKAGYQLRPDFG